MSHEHNHPNTRIPQAGECAACDLADAAAALDEARASLARVTEENARLEERMRVILYAGPSTSLAASVFDRVQRSEAECARLRDSLAEWKKTATELHDGCARLREEGERREQDAREIISDVLTDLRACERLTRGTEERCRVFLARSQPAAWRAPIPKEDAPRRLESRGTIPTSLMEVLPSHLDDEKEDAPRCENPGDEDDLPESALCPACHGSGEPERPPGHESICIGCGGSGRSPDTERKDKP